MTFLIEGASVTIAEVAEAVGSTVETVTAEAASLMGPLGVDWRGRAAVRADEAASLVDGSARRNADHSRAHAEHSLQLEQWERRREDARKAAYMKAHDDALRAGKGEPQAAVVGHPAARAAVAAYERANPKPEFNQSSTVPAAVVKATKRLKEALTR